MVSIILATRALLSLVLPELLPASCYAKCESFPKSVMHLRFFDFNIFTCLKKPVISWTFDPLPARYSGSLWVVLRLAFCFSLQFSAALSHLLFGLCLTDWRVCADGIFLASLRCFLDDHLIPDPEKIAAPVDWIYWPMIRCVVAIVRNSFSALRVRYYNYFSICLIHCQ